MSNHELAEKMANSVSFQREMEKVDYNYRMLVQEAHYSDLSAVEQKLLSKFDAHNQPFDIFFFYELFQLEGRKALLYLVNRLPRYIYHTQTSPTLRLDLLQRRSGQPRFPPLQGDAGPSALRVPPPP